MKNSFRLLQSERYSVICQLFRFFFFLLFLPVVSCGKKMEGEILFPETYKENGLYSYAREHEGRFRSSMALYEDLFQILEAEGREDCDFALSIVFPEMLRYGSARNLMEFLATKLVYSLSPSFGGCTIGHFQMKAAFAETVERYVTLSPRLKAKYPGIDFNGANKKMKDRSKRVGRINDLPGEVDYLYAFIDICTEKFSLESLSEEDRLVLLATAYNAGMSRTKEDLERVSLLNSYPNGFHSPHSEWNYATIALEFYQGQSKSGVGD